MKTKLCLLTLVCVACGASPTASPTVRDLSSWKAPSDDIQFVVSPGWHDGKEFPLTQRLHANPVEKGSLKNEKVPVKNAPDPKDP